MDYELWYYRGKKNSLTIYMYFLLAGAVDDKKTQVLVLYFL